MGANVLATFLGYLTAVIATVGAVYALLAAVLVGRYIRTDFRVANGPRHYPPVTILKPLHLDEPGLARNLTTFCDQNYSGNVQIVFGAHSEGDAAIAVVRTLQIRYPALDIAIVVNSALHGANAKVSNLINMLPAAKHDTLVLSDSDISVSPLWLTQVTWALGLSGVGIVTCLYTGEVVQGESGLWPYLCAMGTSYEFLPNVVTGTLLGLATPCFGSTIALRRKTLVEVGGFNSFANFLADDYEMGRAVRAKGYSMAILAAGVGHYASEYSAADFFRHELRWARTIRTVNPLGHLASLVTLGFPFAVMSAGLLEFSELSLSLLLITLTARFALKCRIDSVFSTYSNPYWLLPLRDLLSFAVFTVSLFGKTVHWRGIRITIESTGAMSRF